MYAFLLGTSAVPRVWPMSSASPLWLPDRYRGGCPDRSYSRRGTCLPGCHLSCPKSN